MSESPAPPPFDIMQTARRLGQYAWVEMRLFEALGEWVATVPELDVKLCLATQSYKHAWHAELWHDAMPELRGVDRDGLTAPASEALVDFLAMMTEPDLQDQTLEKLVGVYRVLIPRKIATYTSHLEMASPIADAPTMRSLKLALNDEIDDWREGEMLIQALIHNDADVARAAKHQARLETAMVASGGITGAGSLGTR